MNQIKIAFEVNQDTPSEVQALAKQLVVAGLLQLNQVQVAKRLKLSNIEIELIQAMLNDVNGY